MTKEEMEVFILRQNKLKLIRKLMSSKNLENVFFIDGRWKELFIGKESLVSSIITAIIIIIFSILYYLSKDIFISSIPNLLVSIIGGYITLIGLSLSAFALVLNVFNRDSFLTLIQLKNEEIIEPSINLLNDMILILYRFYLSAALNVGSVILILGIYVYTIIPIEVPYFLHIILGIIFIYIIVFSLIFTLTLFSTCIKIPFFY